MGCVSVPRCLHASWLQGLTHYLRLTPMRLMARPHRLNRQGDGAGVGKGRQIAALIREFFETGGKHVLWVSTR